MGGKPGIRTPVCADQWRERLCVLQRPPSPPTAHTSQSSECPSRGERSSVPSCTPLPQARWTICEFVLCQCVCACVGTKIASLGALNYTACVPLCRYVRAARGAHPARFSPSDRVTLTDRIKHERAAAPHHRAPHAHSTRSHVTVLLHKKRVVPLPSTRLLQLADVERLPRAKNEIWYQGSETPRSGRRVARVLRQAA